MAPSLFTELQPDQQTRLLSIARESIGHGLHEGRPAPTDRAQLEGILAEPMGSFVTLRKNRELRGCVGSIEPLYPLAEAVAVSAFNAAFRDRRFPRLQATELGLVSVEISVLSPAVPLAVASEDELLGVLEPGTDGLLLEEGPRRSTFLPKVWESLPDPATFLCALKQKAGLPPNYWSDDLRFHRYSSFSFSEPAGREAATA